MASPSEPSAAKRIDAPVPPAPVWRLTDDLLSEIFLRLPALADVGRAATACTAFRRVIADRAFLRRLRSIHRPPVLGLLLWSSILPAEPPHSSAPYGRALGRAADLSFSFLPSGGRWTKADARDGRVLLDHPTSGALAVCDPLSRRYLLLPRIPGHPGGRGVLDLFLVPATDKEAEMSFRVVCLGERKPGQLAASVFSSDTGQWGDLAVGVSVQISLGFLWRSCAYGCFFWQVAGTGDFLALNTRSMEFSTVDIPPPGHGQEDYIIVQAGEGRIRMFKLDNSIISAVSYLVCSVWEKGNDMWQFERRVRLPSQYRFSLADAMGSHLLLRGKPWNVDLESSDDDDYMAYFSVESESMQIERVCVLGSYSAELYIGFPPSLCLPSV